MDSNQLNVGDESTVIGNVKGNIGNRSVVVGAMDSNGNVKLNQTQSMAVGYNAKAGHSSISIGAYSGAGSELFLLLDKLVSKSDGELSEKVMTLISELKSNSRNKTKIETLWGFIKNVVTVGDAAELVAKISPLVTVLLY